MWYDSDDDIDTSSKIEDFISKIIDTKRVKIIYMLYIYSKGDIPQNGTYTFYLQFDHQKTGDSIRSLLDKVGLKGDNVELSPLKGLKEDLFNSYVRYGLNNGHLPYVYYEYENNQKFKKKLFKGR
jgi:hypothetical protein